MPILRTGLALVLLGLCLGCQAPVSPPEPSPEPLAPGPSPVPPIPQSAGMTVLEGHFADQDVQVVLPTNVEQGPQRPLLLFFHSYDRDQTQLVRMTRLARFAADRGWISACGALGGPAHWGNPRSLALHRQLLGELKARYRIDPARVYFVGFSMGGGTALMAAMEARGTPEAPAAVAVSQGFTDLAAMRSSADGLYAASIEAAYQGPLSEADRARGDLVERASELKGLPIYLEHGDADRFVSPSHSQQLARRLQELGSPLTFKLWPGLGHGENTIHDGAIIEFLERAR